MERPGYEKASFGFGRWAILPRSYLGSVPGAFHSGRHGGCQRGSSSRAPETWQHVTPLSSPGRRIGRLLRSSAPSSQTRRVGQ